MLLKIFFAFMINFFFLQFSACVCVQMGKMKGGHTIYYLQFIHFSSCGFHLFYYDIFSINFIFVCLFSGKFLSIFTENVCVFVMIKSKFKLKKKKYKHSFVCFRCCNRIQWPPIKHVRACKITTYFHQFMN